ncbi:hypothetical protein BDZ45DRAFT_693804 [Acephala macrosclerotiorum]|nr:hypothetical protein BDZ45DRAFT_693804 [Acephala macrosclerotiorum]
MSIQEVLEARADFRLRQRERRAQGGPRRRIHQKRDDKPNPSEDESSTKSTQSQTSTSSQGTQATLSTTSLSSVQAITTTSAVSQTSTTVKASVPVTTPLASHHTSTTSPASTPLPATSKQTSLVATTFSPFSIPLAVTTPPIVTSSFSSSFQAGSALFSSSSAAAQTAGVGISSKQSSNNSGPNNSTTIIFGVTGAFAGIFAILAVAFFIRRKFFESKGPKLTVNQQEARAYAARSIWGTSTTTSSSDDRSRTTMDQFVLLITISADQEGSRNGLGNDAVDRQERLQRVRTDILGEREMQLGSGLGSIKQPGRA